MVGHMEQDLIASFQKGTEETKAVQAKLHKIKGVQLESEQTLLGIQRRVNELEVQIGM